MKPNEQLLICGASARAAAQSAVRAGLQPFAVDLFNDADLLKLCPALQVAAGDYPHGLLYVSQRAPPGPWMYTGGLENHPDLVDAIGRTRSLWGNDGQVLRVVRDPFRVARALQKAGLRAPEVLPEDGDVPVDGTWLVKPLQGSGGSGIAMWHGKGLTAWRARHHYFQKFIQGTPHAAIYFGDGETALLLGVTRQLVGETWLHARPFAYCGSIGSVSPPSGVEHELRLLGECLGQALRLRGLFGVDFVLSAGHAWPIEINPRYTASVEVLEALLRQAFLALSHWHFVQGKRCVGLQTILGTFNLPWFGPPTATLHGVVVKCIYFAKEDAVFDLDASELPKGCADVPRPGTQLQAGHPVLTLLEVGESADACLELVRSDADWLDRRLSRR